MSGVQVPASLVDTAGFYGNFFFVRMSQSVYQVVLIALALILAAVHLILHIRRVQAFFISLGQNWFSLSYSSLFIFLPFLYVSFRDFHFIFSHRGSDRFFFEAEELRFRLSLFWLLLGRFRIYVTHLQKPLLHYFNRVDSHKKKRFLPKPNRFLLYLKKIHEGYIFIEDETMTPTFRLCLSDINVSNMKVHADAPVSLFFHIREGSSKLAGGELKIQSSRKSGTIELNHILWSELFNSQNIPLLGPDFSLAAEFQKNQRNILIRGIAGSPKNIESKDSVKSTGGLRFKFNFQPEKYQTTLDLGLQKLISEILRTAKTTWLSTGLVWGGRGLFELLKKQED